MFVINFTVTVKQKHQACGKTSDEAILNAIGIVREILDTEKEDGLGLKTVSTEMGPVENTGTGY